MTLGDRGGGGGAWTPAEEGGGVEKWALVLGPCVPMDVAAEGVGTQILTRKNFPSTIFPPHMCSQNDQRDVGIIPSHICWGPPPPPLARPTPPTPTPTGGLPTCKNFWLLQPVSNHPRKDNLTVSFLAVVQIDRSLASGSQIRSCTYPSLFRFFFYIPLGLPINHGTISEQGPGLDVLVRRVAGTVFFR